MHALRRSCCLFLLAGALAGKAYGDELVVSAAASLTDAFQEIGRTFEAGHPGNHVVFNFAASGPLLQQIAQGAPADVFASADEDTMDRAQQQKLIAAATRIDFAANTLVLVVPAAAKAVPGSPADLLGPAFRRIAIGNPATVPAGRYARQALDLAGIGSRLEQKLIPADSVRQVLSYVARGEVDAGFVYASDAAIERDKVRIALKLATQSPIRYPIAQVAASRLPTLAQAFIAEVRSPAAQVTLQRYGFAPP